jgi:hypothetical protein
MNWFVVFLILILALAGMGTIWYLGTQASCKLPPKNTCTGYSTTGSGRLQVPYCADETSKPECEDPEILCGTVPADCNSPYCDYTSKKWVCSTETQKWSCMNNTCTIDPNGKFSSLTDCSKTCYPPDKSCELVSGNLPYPVTDGSTVYANFTKVPDQYGTYNYKMIGSESACQISCDSTKSKLASDKNSIWCDPIDDGTSCSSTQLSSIKQLPTPPETYKGTYPDTNANYVLAYMNYNNRNQYCKFSNCLQPSYKIGTDNKCFKKCTITDQYATETDDNCKITKCSKGQPKPDGSGCGTGTCPDIQFATGYDANCNPTGCSDPSDSITVYGVDQTGKFCTGKSCTQPSGDFYQYTNTGTLGKCVKTNTCIPNSDSRKLYDPNNNCNAICSGDSCKAFIGVDASDGYPFSCDNAGRSCTVHSDGTGWGGCGSATFPQYGPKGDGTCGQTIFEQRARFSTMGCITCLGGINCDPWQTDTSKCSYAEGCTYGEAKRLGTPTDAINECVNENKNKYIGYIFNNITTLPSGEQASLYTNDGSINGNLNGGDYIWKGMSPGPFSFNKSSGSLIAGNGTSGCDSSPLSLSGVFNSMTNPPRNSGSLSVYGTGDCEYIAGEIQGEIDIKANY